MMSPEAVARRLTRITDGVCPWWGLAIVIVSTTSWPTPLEARDTDGNRLGAELREVGTTTRDTLSPPEDSTDWSYFKLETKRNVTIELKVTSSKGGSADMSLVGGTGEELESTQLEGEGRVKVQASLKAGLYYIEVSSDAKISYRLGIE